MSESVVYAPRPRYVVQVASTIQYLTGTEQGQWNDVRFFNLQIDAEAYADREAEDHAFVRVIDRGESD